MSLTHFKLRFLTAKIWTNSEFTTFVLSKVGVHNLGFSKFRYALAWYIAEYTSWFICCIAMPPPLERIQGTLFSIRMLNHLMSVREAGYPYCRPVILSRRVTTITPTDRPKQNRESTKGCSNSMDRKNTEKFGKKIGLNKYNICKPQMWRDKVSGGVSVPCQHASSVAYVLYNFFYKSVISRVR